MVLSVLLTLSLAVAPEVSGGALFNAGDAAQRAGMPENAVQLFLECAYASDILRPYALSRAAYNQHLAGKAHEAVRQWHEVLTEYPEGPWVRLTQARLGALHLAREDRRQAREALNTMLDGCEPVPWFLDSLARQRAENALALPEYAHEGYAWFRRVAETTLYVTPRREAAKHLLQSPELEDRRWGIYGYTRSGNLGEARTAMMQEPILVHGPGAMEMPLSILDATFAGAETDLDAAVERLEALVRNNTDNSWVRIWLMLAAREEGVKRRYAAAEALAWVLSEYFPSGRDAGDVYWWLSERYTANSQTADALRVYRLLSDRCPDHVRAPRSLYNLANHARESGHTEQAYALYETLGAAHPQGIFTAEGFYRCAQMAAAQGDKEKEQHYLSRAIGVGLGHFFAHRALHRLRETLDVRPATGRALRVAVSDDFVQPFPLSTEHHYTPHALITHTDVYKRLKFFGIHGHEEGEWEALWCILTSTESLEKQWYPVIANAGFMHTLMQYVTHRGWGLEDGRPTLTRLRLTYPLAYWPKTYAISEDLNLDPYLLLAIAKQESTFRAGVVSHAGATGVLQLMPPTARWLADVDGRITHEHVAHLKSPYNSIRLGAVYMQRMITRSQGNLVYALASYNAGPGNLDKWRARFANYDIESFAEAIPFAETNDYVKKVLANYAAYHSIYPAPEALNRLVASSSFRGEE